MKEIVSNIDMHILYPGQSILGTSIKGGVPVLNLISKCHRHGAGPGVSATWNQSSLGHSILEPVTMLLPLVHNIRRWLSSKSSFTKKMREAHDKMNTDIWNTGITWMLEFLLERLYSYFG